MDLLKRFIKYYKPHKKIFIADMAASFLVAVIGMGYPIITRYMLNDFIPNKKIDLQFSVILFLDSTCKLHTKRQCFTQQRIPSFVFNRNYFSKIY